MENKFLKNLQTALEDGVENTSTTKINEILNHTEKVILENDHNSETLKAFRELSKPENIRRVDEATAIKQNVKSEVELAKIKYVDMINNTIANTIHLDDMIIESISILKEHLFDVRKFLDENKENFKGLNELNNLNELLNKLETKYKE